MNLFCLCYTMIFKLKMEAGWLINCTHIFSPLLPGLSSKKAGYDTHHMAAGEWGISTHQGESAAFKGMLSVQPLPTILYSLMFPHLLLSSPEGTKPSACEPL